MAATRKFAIVRRDNGGAEMTLCDNKGQILGFSRKQAETAIKYLEMANRGVEYQYKLVGDDPSGRIVSGAESLSVIAQAKWFRL